MLPSLICCGLTMALKGGFMFIIYRAKNLVTGLSYIGQTTRKLHQRITSHYGSKSTAFSLVLKNTCETEWEWSIIDTASSVNEAHEKECYWIAFHRTMTNGYNSPYTHYKSQETRDKISLRNKGKKPWNSGRNNVYTKEAIERFSLAKLGKKTGPISDSRRESITRKVQESVGRKVINLETQEIYPSVSQAAKEIGVAHNTIKRILSGVIKNSKIKVSYYQNLTKQEEA